MYIYELTQFSNNNNNYKHNIRAAESLCAAHNFIIPLHIWWMRASRRSETSKCFIQTVILRCYGTVWQQPANMASHSSHTAARKLIKINQHILNEFRSPLKISNKCY